LTANAQQHNFNKLWNKVEAEGKPNAATSETPEPLYAIVKNEPSA
jgi:hypothetical protein